MQKKSIFSKSFVHLIVLFITLVWALPTLGLLITSVRDPGDVADSGWWMLFASFKSPDEIVAEHNGDWVREEMDALVFAQIERFRPDFDMTPEDWAQQFQAELNTLLLPHLQESASPAGLEAVIDLHVYGREPTEDAPRLRPLAFDRLLGSLSGASPEDLTEEFIDQVVGRRLNRELTGLQVALAQVVEAPQQLGGFEVALRVISSPFTYRNYGVLFEENLDDAFINSWLISLPASILPIFAAALAAFAIAWMRFPGRRIVLVFMIIMLIVPLQLSFIPVLRAYKWIDVNIFEWMHANLSFLTPLLQAMDLEKWSGSLPAVWFVHSGYAMPLMIFLLYNFIVELPKELFESASIDGASTWQTFRKVVFPLALPGMAAAFIFQFLWVWNSLLVNLIYLGFGSKYQPLPLVVTDIGQFGQEWHKLTAAAFILIIVPMLIFFGLQRYFIRGLLGGSVKG